MFRQAVQSTQIVGVDRWFWRLRTSPLDPSREFDFNEWLSGLRSKLGVAEFYAAVVWPAHKNRARLYVHLLKTDGEPLAFAKIALDRHNDREIAAEARALVDIASLGLTRCRVPRVLKHGQWNGRTFLVSQPLPDRIRSVEHYSDSYPTQVVAELSGRETVLTETQLRELEWWQRLELDDSCHAFRSELDQVIQNGLAVCRVHGDLGPGNLVTAGDELWLFDWEQSDHRGPRVTDPVNFYLALRQAHILSDPRRGATDFRRHFFGSDGPYTYEDVVAALAFLHQAGVQAARAIVSQWNSWEQ